VDGSISFSSPGGYVQELRYPEKPDPEGKTKPQYRLQNGQRWQLGSVTLTTTPARYAGRLIAGTADGRIHAVADNGVYLWNFTTGGRTYSSPVADGDDVYFGSDDGKL
jgi:outer membrane protein assembly factor BamB